MGQKEIRKRLSEWENPPQREIKPLAPLPNLRTGKTWGRL
jgi:hypothetical protein